MLYSVLNAAAKSVLVERHTFLLQAFGTVGNTVNRVMAYQQDSLVLTIVYPVSEVSKICVGNVDFGNNIQLNAVHQNRRGNKLLAVRWQTALNIFVILMELILNRILKRLNIAGILQLKSILIASFKRYIIKER